MHRRGSWQQSSFEPTEPTRIDVIGTEGKGSVEGLPRIRELQQYEYRSEQLNKAVNEEYTAKLLFNHSVGL